MRHNGLAPIPYESRVNRTLRARHEQQHMLEVAQRIARETNTSVGDAVKYASKLPGDPISLRGIPAIGRGVIGAQPSTRPGHGLE